MQDKETKELLYETEDEISRKKFLLYNVTRKDGSQTYQLIIVDAVMTFNIDMSASNLVNLQHAIIHTLKASQ